MKSGASDPFADQEDDETQDEGSVDSEVESAKGSVQDQNAQGSAAESRQEIVNANSARSDTAKGGSEPEDDSNNEGSLSRDQLPFVLRRDKVKDERPEVHQLFVQKETHQKAVDAERELQDRLDDDLSRTDAREAIYLAGMEQLGDAENLLREWGYDL